MDECSEMITSYMSRIDETINSFLEGSANKRRLHCKVLTSLVSCAKNLIVLEVHEREKRIWEIFRVELNREIRKKEWLIWMSFGKEKQSRYV